MHMIKQTNKQTKQKSKIKLQTIDQSLNDVVQEMIPVIACDDIVSILLLNFGKLSPIRLHVGKNKQHFPGNILNW